MRASATILLFALAMAGCSVYDEASGVPSGATAGGSGSGGAAGGPSGGFSGSGGSVAKDGSSDATGSVDASGAAGTGGTSGTGGTTGAGGAAGASGTAGTGGTSDVDGATGAGGASGTGATSGAGGAAGASGTAGAAGNTGADGSSGIDGPSGVDRSDAGQPCVSGPGPANLPFAVDQYFVASGWMQPALIRQDSTCVYPPIAEAGTGDSGRDASAGADSATGSDAPRDGSQAGDATVPPLPGSKCWTITYAPTASTDWAGVDWQYPINNWGPSPGLVIPPGAAHVSLVAWGETGSETVSFNVGYGVTSPDAFAASLNNQVLTTSPTRYAVDMSGIAYTCNSVRMGFGWVASGGTAMTFHIADIRWE